MRKPLLDWTRSFSTQLMVYAVVLLMVMLLLAALISLLAARPSAEQMARSFSVIGAVAEQHLSLQPRGERWLPQDLTDAGVFAVLPVGSRQSQTWLPFANALREALTARLQRPVQLVVLPDGETAIWLPSSSPEQLPFGIRFEPARGPVARSGVWVIVATIALIMAAAWILARWLSRPLRQLSRALPGLAAGAPLPPLGPSTPAEIRSLAEALKEAMDRLRDQSLAREQTLAGISHDLRTPLMRMNLAAQMLPEGKYAAQIQSNVAEMDQLIGSALELARAGRDEAAERVDLSILVQRLTADDHGAWQLLIDPTLRVFCPPIALRRSLQNLIINATRHGQPPYSVRSQIDPGELLLIVADSGSGFGELGESAARQAFRQGQSAGGGTGLGLAIVDRLAASFDSILRFEQVDGEFRAILAIPLGRVEGALRATSPTD